MVKKTRNMRRRKNRKQTQRGGVKFIDHLKRLFSGDPLVPTPPAASAPPLYDDLEAKDLLSSLSMLSDILSRVRMTTAHDINDLNRRISTLEALAAHQPHATAARATAPPLSIAARWQ
jgi:hypothetical protein